MLPMHRAQQSLQGDEVPAARSESRMWTLEVIMAMQKALEDGIPEHDSADLSGHTDKRRKQQCRLPSTQEQGEWSAHVPDITDFLRKLFRRFFPGKHSESMTA